MIRIKKINVEIVKVNVMKRNAEVVVQTVRDINVEENLVRGRPKIEFENTMKEKIVIFINVDNWVNRTTRTENLGQQGHLQDFKLWSLCLNYFTETPLEHFAY